MKAYKGFNDKLQCTGGDSPFQYEIGKTYEEPRANLCNSGFHACEDPIDVLGYYAPGVKSRYCEVELEGVTDQHKDDSKRVGKKITIGAEIGIHGIVKAHFEYIKAHTTSEHIDPKQATAGDSGAATSRGTVSVGKDGIGLARGNDVKAKGGLGSVLVICIENDANYDIKEWKSAYVDGEKIKADTFYTLKDGEFVEADEPNA